MAKSKKGGKKQKKKSGVKQEFGGMSPDQVADRGAQWLASGNARDALKAFKFLKKSGYEPGIVSLGLFQSYLVRYGQLMEKNMVKEADVVLAAALEFSPTGGDMPLETLEQAIRFLPLSRAVVLYREALVSMDSVPELERLIANRAVLEEKLDTLDLLPGDPALVKEKEILKPACVSMNAGHWGDAVKALAKITRKSPFVDIKIFSKLMAAFTDQDKPGVQKALSMLDDKFFLINLRELLSEYAAGDDLPQLPGKDETAALLWGQAFFNQVHAGQLRLGVEKSSLAMIGKAVKGLAVSFDPPDRESGVEFLAEISAQALMDKEKDLDQILALFKKLSLPNPLFMLARFAAPRGGFLNEYAGEVWKKLDLLFPDKGEQDLAKALILVTIAEKIITDSDFLFNFEDELDGFFSAVGLSDKVCFDDVEIDDGEDLAAFSILEQALALDPENQKCHELILGLSFDSPALRKALPPLLEEMAAAFIHDPKPHVRLAQIYLQKSAVRKAESALKKAFSRAPHDGEVLKQYALCHVTAACKNIKLRKHELALKDLDAAEAMGVSSLGVYILEKRLVCDFAKDLKFSRKTFEQITHGLTSVDALRVLALFKLDLEDPDYKFPSSPWGLAVVFNTHKKKIKELASGEIAALLKPVPTLFQGLYFKKSYASFFLGKQAALLSLLTDRDLMEIAIDLARYEYLDQVADQLSKRVDMVKTDDDSLSLRFFYLSFACMQDIRVESRIFMQIVDSASPTLRERLRTISRQIAPIAQERHQPAFESFDFTLLDRPSFMEDLHIDSDSDDFEGLSEVLEQIMEGRGGAGIKNAIETIIGQMNTISGLDDFDELYDIDLEGFNAEKAFEGRIGNREIFDLVYDIVEDALYLQDSKGAQEIRENSKELIESLDALMEELKDSGFDSPDDFRRAGKGFYRNINYGREILLGFSTASKHRGLSISRDLKSFILGMKQES